MAPAPLTDHQAALDALRAGDPAGLAPLYEAHRQELYFFAYTYLRHREAAEEIVQDTFLKLWEQRDRIRPDESIRAYLFQLTRYAALDALRRLKVEDTHHRYLLTTAGVGHSEQEAQFEWADYQQLIQRAVAHLPPPRQHLFRLSREHELTYEEIARSTNLSVKAVEKQMMKALRFIRAYVRKHAGLTTATLLAMVEHGL